VKFFIPSLEQQVYDGRVVRFNSYPQLPAPPTIFLYEHFKQAVLANMKGAGKIPFLDYDPDEDSRSLDTFDTDDRKEILEHVLKNKLAGLEGDRSFEVESIS
jgi:hypothetical protein